jgi:hypothetical protein
MNNVIRLKFLTVDDLPEVVEHSRRGWKFKSAGKRSDGVELYAVFIKDGEERECHVLHCPKCINSEIEVYHLEWSLLTCPLCGDDIAIEDWITEDEFLDLCEQAYE